ncbi:hypothetical protein V502_06092 [Pseudogymnoascus sp. VKM F-4520 (FW-2644)]|nr:hypothetical protein V502_06092 [Pseudogymnoascus sp. VKM F-4520 (FW-2644)]
MGLSSVQQLQSVGSSSSSSPPPYYTDVSATLHLSLGFGSFEGLPETVRSLDPVSRRLLQFYAERIAPLLLAAPHVSLNPFVCDVLPLAFSHQIAMNAILATGAFSLDSEDTEAVTKSLHYYGQTVADLKSALVGCDVASFEGTLLLLLVTTLCSLHEIFGGNVQGAFFLHNRAVRHFAQAVHSRSDEQDYNPLAGALLELYAYHELGSSLRLPLDLNDVKAISTSSVLQSKHLRRFATFGCIIGCAAELYGMVPQICQLATRPRDETGEVDKGYYDTLFQHLERSIKSWSVKVACDSAYSDEQSHQRSPDAVEIAAGMLVRNAVLIFLYSAYYLDEKCVLQISQPLVDESIELRGAIDNTPWITSTFWPLMVVGSYAHTPRQREQLLQFLPPRMPLLRRAVEILQWLWNEPEHIFGLQGLAYVLDKHDTSYCFG